MPAEHHRPTVDHPDRITLADLRRAVMVRMGKRELGYSGMARESGVSLSAIETWLTREGEFSGENVERMQAWLAKPITRAPRAPRVGEGWLSIKSVAALSGVTVSVLRVWEARYGWPKPERHPVNDYRRYPPIVVQQIKDLVAARSRGMEMRDLINRDGQLTLPAAAPSPTALSGKVRKHLLEAAIAGIPLPTGRLAMALRTELVLGLLANDPAPVGRVLHQAALISPHDRDVAITQLVRAAIETLAAHELSTSCLAGWYHDGREWRTVEHFKRKVVRGIEG